MPTVTPVHTRMSVNVAPPAIKNNISGRASIDAPLLAVGEVDVCRIAEDEGDAVPVEIEQVSTCGSEDTLHPVSTNAREQFIVTLTALAILTEMSVSVD